MTQISDLQPAAQGDALFDELVCRAVDQLASGEGVDLATLAVDNPELAARLAKVLPALEAVVELGRTETSHSAHPSTTAAIDIDDAQPATRVLGDFRILRELGRGGMGVVYEAEQVSLGRRVALKVLPLAAMLDKQQLARFKIEARAAASLKHPHIVGVHSVGVERGVHYYAMELVEGRSLAQVVNEFRISDCGLRNEEVADTSPQSEIHNPQSEIVQSAIRNPQSEIETVAALSTLRTTRPAEFFRSAARLGIQAGGALHYAHQMGVVHRDVKPSNLLVDDDGHLWITDFGLAMTQADAGLTMSGDLLGTLRYMSPEQAAGKGLPLDHRTDVYSLGATLYELLAGRPAFDMSDRNELLRAISDVDPPPLRKLVPAIPIDLETIVGKAMEKNAVDRYGSAQEMRHDLEQFLEHRPITARPPTLWQQTAKWSRRHVAVVWAASLVSLAAAIGLGTSTWLISSARDDAVTARKETEAEAGRAQRNLDLAIESLDRIYTELIGTHLANEPRLTRVREEFLRQALEFYQRFARENEADELAWAETGRAYLTAGRIHMELNQIENAGTAFFKSIDVFASLTQQFPTDPQYSYEAAEATAEAGSMLIQMGLVQDGLDALADAFRTLEPSGDPATDQSLARQLESAEHAALLGNILQRLGNAYSLAGQTDDAQEAYRRALRLCRPLAERRPADPHRQRELASTLARLAMLNATSREAADAISLVEAAIRHQRRALELAPDSVESRRALRNHFHTLGSIRRIQGETDLALEAHRQGNQLAVQLARDFPHVSEDQMGLAFSNYSLASVLVDVGQLDQAQAKLDACLSYWKGLPSGEEVFLQIALFHDTASYHLDSILHKTGSDAIFAFRQKVGESLGTAEAEAVRESIVEKGDALVAQFDHTDPCPLFKKIIHAIDSGDVHGVRTLLQHQISPTDDLISEFSKEVLKDERLASVTRVIFGFSELLFGHARALTELAVRLEEARQAEHAKSESTTNQDVSQQQ